MTAVADIEMAAEGLNAQKAAEVYREHGCLVVRGLMRRYAEAILADAEQAADLARSHVDQAKKIPEGWTTPDGTLWLPAPEGYQRDKQIMVLAMSYTDPKNS